MRRGGNLVLLAGLAVAGLVAGVFVASGGASAKASHPAVHSTATTHVTVTATDSKFKLSKRSAARGTVIFTVTNKGKVSHDFKIAGKKSPLLLPGRSARLWVTFSRKGRYLYRSTVSGQASHGMKGVFSVVAAVAPKPTPPPTPTTAPAPTTTATVGTANTTVTVSMHEGSFRLSQPTMPSGMVTFVITSSCDGGCSFDLEGIKAGTVLYTGHAETWTVPLAPGNYRYHCDVQPRMKGSLTVTP
jgi:plastocyanin